MLGELLSRPHSGPIPHGKLCPQSQSCQHREHGLNLPTGLRPPRTITAPSCTLPSESSALAFSASWLRDFQPYFLSLSDHICQMELMISMRSLCKAMIKMRDYSLVAQMVKNLFAVWETQVQSFNPGSGRSGEGDSNPLQYSCLENPMDRGTWWAIVCRVARVGHDLVTKLPPHFPETSWERKGNKVIKHLPKFAVLIPSPVLSIYFALMNHKPDLYSL